MSMRVLAHTVRSKVAIHKHYIYARESYLLQIRSLAPLLYASYKVLTFYSLHSSNRNRAQVSRNPVHKVEESAQQLPRKSRSLKSSLRPRTGDKITSLQWRSTARYYTSFSSSPSSPLRPSVRRCSVSKAKTLLWSSASFRAWNLVFEFSIWRAKYGGHSR